MDVGLLLLIEEVSLKGAVYVVILAKKGLAMYVFLTGRWTVGTDRWMDALLSFGDIGF